MNTKQTTLFLVICLTCYAFFVSCSGGSSKTNNNRNRLIPAVEAVKADYGALPLVERLSGVVKAKNQVEIYPEISAVVEKVHVQSGDNVSKNSPLVSLRDKEFQERLKQAEAALQIATAQARQAEARLKEINNQLKRTKSLAEKELTSSAELENIETEALSAQADVELANARVQQAQATVAEEQENLSRTIIRAPVNGTVGSRNAEVGMRVNSGTRLFTLGKLDTVKVEVVLTDRMLTYIETGQRAEIFASILPDGVTSANLSRISPFLHPVTHSTEAEIDLPNPNHYLKSGMFTTVDLFYGESENATIVPLSSLYENPLTGETGVYVSRDTANTIPANRDELNASGGLTQPVPFEFVPVEVLVKGRMSVGVRGIEADNWVVTIGQDLFGGEPGSAKMRPVDWSWVEHLQNLQREDLLEEITQKKKNINADTISVSPGS